ncbi:S8 family serine peptidase [Pedobacter insulae]|uniref:Subtilase family protein n=1 Tax=Pedobacter insulae TaxID=414048 RepID=A0A1I2ZGZ9_9SPHI|nr:S8 family serine peptidase [Pedobacter insulae]SFH36856.1 Subtilase family protein [Pedobacter insulae]
MKLKIYIFIILLFATSTQAIAQEKNVILPKNWFNLDLATSGYFGISTEKAYKELLVNKTPKEKIIVAVIDGGTDIKHEDLKDVLWTNPKEIPDNGIDDDDNGYIDDIHGWNFIGSKKGNLTYDNLELVRILKKYKPKYQATIMTTVLDSTERAEFRIYKRAEAEFGRRFDEASQAFPIYIAIKKVLDTVAFSNKKKIPSLADIERYKADDEFEEQIIKIIRKGSKDEGGIEKFYTTIEKGYKELDVMLRYNLNEKFDERAEMVGDDYSNSAQRYYGNNDVAGPDPEHGTHVSGIIGANRNNELGILGVANNVSIMSIRVVPQGDERDKDVANGIRYAVDNGARVINMSFGKGFKWDKKAVDEAVKYAESKGVLLVHAAGNDNSNNDEVENYPNKYFESPEATAYWKANPKRETFGFTPPKRVENQPSPYGYGYGDRGFKVKVPEIVIDTAKFNLPHATNWIEVGASSYKDDSDLKASFSNYGKYNVDVFAPGFMINSTVPNSKYEENDGTSMAAPVVSGLSALILSYYPNLKPAEVRDIIIKSVSKVDHKVKYKNEKGETVRSAFSEICVSGGIVNAYNALLLAETYNRAN